jgi:hypothetical protein
MPSFPKRSELSPKSESLMSYTETQKTKLQITPGYGLPGLNISVNHDRNAFWFKVAMFGELLGLLLTIWGGVSYGDVGLGIAVILVVALFIVADWFIARLRISTNNGIICLNENLKESYSPPKGDAEKMHKIEQCNVKIAKAKQSNTILTICLFLMACVKTLALFFVGSVFGSTIFVIAMGVYFLIIAYIHSTISPYYFGYIKTKSNFNTDYNNEYSLPAEKMSRPFMLQADLSNDFLSKKNVDNAVFIISTGNAHEYLIKTKSIIYDDDIKLLIGGFGEDDQKVIAKACHELQCRM